MASSLRGVVQNVNGEIKMAKAATPKKRAVAKKSAMEKSARLTKATQAGSTKILATNKQKNSFEERFGEGTAFDLDYGKLLIIALCIYIAVQVS